MSPAKEEQMGTWVLLPVSVVNSWYVCVWRYIFHRSNLNWPIRPQRDSVICLIAVFKSNYVGLRSKIVWCINRSIRRSRWPCDGGRNRQRCIYHWWICIIHNFPEFFFIVIIISHSENITATMDIIFSIGGVRPLAIFLKVTALLGIWLSLFILIVEKFFLDLIRSLLWDLR